MMDRSPDISKVVEIIMENPDLIERIGMMMKEGSDGDQSEKAEALPPKDGEGEKEASAPAQGSAEARRHNRTRLLGAMKPYLNESRVKAIDTMIGIVDALDMMRGR